MEPTFFTIFFSLTIFLVYLAVERIQLSKYRKKIPLVICITGTRGKSTIVRLLKSILDKSGKKVVAKVSGSKAVLICPDGKEQELDRKMAPSILEQKKILKICYELSIDVLVIEIMSVTPENHYIESCRILKPDILLISNIRLDHTDVMGPNVKNVAKTLALTIMDGCKVFVNKTDFIEYLKNITKEKKVSFFYEIEDENLIETAKKNINNIEFNQNIGLVMSVCNYLAIPQKTIFEGMKKATQDIGISRDWQIPIPGNKKKLFIINAFAANDPTSTKAIFDIYLKKGFSIRNFCGILNLRDDRWERTRQWIKELSNDSIFTFKILILIGDRASCSYVKKKLKDICRIEIFNGKTPNELISYLFSLQVPNPVYFCFGNIKGPGINLIEYLNSEFRND